LLTKIVVVGREQGTRRDGSGSCLAPGRAPRSHQDQTPTMDGKTDDMRYLRHLARSPRLALQLLILLLLAVLVGGTGLLGLHLARETITTISTVRTPALMRLKDTERAIAQ